MKEFKEEGFNYSDHHLLTLLELAFQEELKYEAFAAELAESNRFILSQKQGAFLEEFEKAAEQFIVTTEKNSVFYRARHLEKDFLNQNFLDISQFSLSFDQFIPVFLSLNPEFNQTNTKNTTENDPFQGYGKEASNAPPPEFAKVGRLNPAHISYVYTAEELDTAIQEIRPQIGQKVSVATIVTLKELRILDLTQHVLNNNYIFPNNKDYTKKTLYEVITSAFQRPNYGEPLHYLPTQYLSEYVKNIMCLDGIRFWSSLKKGGKNVVFFQSKHCEAVSSQLMLVEDIQLQISKL